MPTSQAAARPSDPPSGLDHGTAAARLLADGPNELEASRGRSLWAIALEVVREPLFLLLLGAGAVYLAMGDAHEALALLGFVVIIMGVTVLQERRTDNALQALRELSSPRALVIRDGVARRIAGREVVRDDLMVVSEGDRVPADGSVIEAHELALDESMQTGESQAVPKQSGDLLYAGTLVVRGQGLVRVTATGQRTALGRIGKSLQTIALESSPLRDDMARLTSRLVVAGIVISLALAVLFWFMRGGWQDAMLAGITLAMSVLPQEFPVIMIIFLALGARRLASQQVLTRRLNAIETLGQTTVLCVDKTGTLTENRMAVAALSVGGQTLHLATPPAQDLPEPYHELLEYAVLASEVEPHDPMEKAFHQMAGTHLAGSDHLHPEWSLVREYELSPELLAMSHLWRGGSGEHDVVAAKGAPEAIASLCDLTPEQHQQVSLQAARLAETGLRVLGVAKARHRLAEPWPDAQHDFDFEFVGLVGLADPLRAEVPAAVAQCQRAGIRVVMITGDHAQTAQAIAAQAGIATARVLRGDDLAGLDARALAQAVAGVNVFARVTPQQKLILVEALKAGGEVVAMTGDGVNDAPALKAAHIGIAMGQRGTDVAREAASLVLLQDDFAAIVGAIKLGRRIYANLRQAMVYTLAVHVPIIGLSVLPVLFGLPLVLAPLHIAFLELVIDPACSIVFEAEQDHAGLMNRPPRPRAERLVSAAHIAQALVPGLLVTLLVFGVYFVLLDQGMEPGQARTAAFILLVTANAALIFPTRSEQPGWKNLFTGLSAVPVWVLVGTFAALVLATTVVPVTSAFGFVPLPALHWLAAFAIGVSMLVVFQVSKRVLHRM